MKLPFSLKVLIGLILLGQLVFLMASPRYTAPSYEGRIYATIGVELIGNSDLHKLNEAAHFFGQTIIGWTKFPNFVKNLREKAGLSADADFSAHMQERQNIVFAVHSSKPVEATDLFEVKNYLQGKLVEYNESSSTGFMLSNLDYEQLETTRSYAFGAAVALALSVLIWLGFWYVKREV
ncbi:MAG: hypothetical protein V1760_03940 [Candidatus Peregrinibacteria bacterium]